MAWAKGKSEQAIVEGLAKPGSLNPMMSGLSLKEQDRQAMAAWIIAEGKGDK